MTYIPSNNNNLSLYNNTTTPLNTGATFTGVGELSSGVDVLVSCKTDQDGSLFLDLSNDGTNWDTFPVLGYSVSAGIHEIHNAVKGYRYFRVRFTNTSASNQTYLRIYTYFGTYKQLNSPLNASIQNDSDASVTRSFGEEFLIGGGYVSGYSVVNKVGINQDVDTASVPEDMWNGGGIYTGFPTGAPEEFQVFSSSASDTGTLTFMYLASTTSTSYQTGTVTLNGTTPVNTGITGYRMHTANYDTANPTTFNVGEITIRHRTTTTNIFCKMPIGRSQTNVAAYTVPYGYTCKLERLFAGVNVGTAGTFDGGLWVRNNGMSPRLRRPFSASNSVKFEEKVYSGLTFPALTDITIRVTTASANNLDIYGGFDLVLIKL